MPVRYLGAAFAGGAVALAPIPGAAILGGAVSGFLTGLADGQTGRELLKDTVIGASAGLLFGGLRFLGAALGKVPATTSFKFTEAVGVGCLGMVAPALYDLISQIPPEIAIPDKSARLRALESALVSLQDSVTAGQLQHGIQIVLKVPPLSGMPGQVHTLSDVYDRAAGVCRRVANDLSTIGTAQLPQSWRGLAGETAIQAVRSVVDATVHAGNAFDAACEVTRDWAEVMSAAQQRDSAAVAKVQRVVDWTGTSVGAEVRNEAIAGCRERIEATTVYERGAAICAAAMDATAQRARARTIKAAEVDPLTAILLAYTGSRPTSADPSDDILSPIALRRTSDRIATLSPADRTRFWKLLSDAKSPQEAAYLWQALAADYSMDDIAAFATQIHPHGDDMAWLLRHLHIAGNPHDASDDKSWIGYTSDDVEVALYEQDQPNCPTASTVVARLHADPVLMLGITTGTGPAAVSGPPPGTDTTYAFRDRLRHTFDDNFDPPSTQYPRGNQEMVNRLLAPVTGSSYEMVALSSEDARRVALYRIEDAVASGKPVPIDLRASGFSADHQVVVIGQRPGQLLIYNPWGFTRWITNEQFIKAQMPDIPNPYRVILPR